MESKSLIEQVVEAQKKQDRLVAEWVLRAATLERVLLSKGIITSQELAEAYLDSMTKMNDFMKSAVAQHDNENTSQE